MTVRTVLMSRVMHLAAIAGMIAVCGALPMATQAGSGAAQRQGRGAERGVDPENPGVTPGDVQKMFDAYALMQAQEQLKISDEQFTSFLTRFKALQEVRRQMLRERAGILMNLRRLTNATPLDEAQVRDRLTALQDLEARFAAEVKKSYEAIDQVLDLRQQGQFRVFEELMERRKLELVMRARQGNRPRPQ
jgi:Spy/CpxP family protein refolding chaperone